jgi:hypothetical protein
VCVVFCGWGGSVSGLLLSRRIAVVIGGEEGRSWRYWGTREDEEMVIRSREGVEAYEKIEGLAVAMAVASPIIARSF